MKDNTFNSEEIEFLDGIHEFFGTRIVTNHLTFIDKWMELLLGGKRQKKWTKRSDLYFYHEKIERLFEAAYHLHEATNDFATLEASCKVSKTFLATEKQALTYFPYQLRENELLNPIKALVTIFRTHDFNYYQQILKEWMAKGLSSKHILENSAYIIPLYGNAKKLIAICWLIHERIMSKNSLKNPTYANTLLNFALTEPLLFIEEQVNDPFSMLESFFSFTNLSGYRAELQKWYMAAITKDLVYENSNDLFFIHNQYIQLIQAGYLITSKKLNYLPKHDNHDGKTLGQWLIEVRDRQIEIGKLSKSDEEPHALSLAERAAPMDYCRKTLSLSQVAKLRLGLKEWFNAGLSHKSSIHGLDSGYAFGQYLTLQKLTEAFYLIITANVNTLATSIVNVSHEA